MNGEGDSEARDSGSATAAASGSGGTGQDHQSRRTVCDHCRRRRIRCDGHSPCQQCNNASLTCKREHVPRKRGPKRGHGRVINELRAQEAHEKDRHSRESSMDLDPATDSGGPPSAATSVPSSPPDISWASITSDPRNAPEPRGAFSSEQFRPTSRSYLPLVPQCVDLYYEHIYPIMPLPYMPALRELVAWPNAMSPSERNYVYALCALTCFHMSGQSIDTATRPPHPSWEIPGRFFLDECIAVRQAYDFFEDLSLRAVVSSFWLSTSFFEINQSRKSWVYLREALTLALDLGLHDDATYVGLSPEETLCRQRVFWQLFVTERSFAILRNKPITFKKTPSLPTTRHAYEAPDIHSGFLQLISSYVPLDESFVAAWNDGSDPRVSATTYLALQSLLAAPPAFLTRSSRSRPRTPVAAEPPTITDLLTGAPLSSPTTDEGPPQQRGDEPDQDPEPTAIQKADLLITQQWLRLIVWQSSFRQGLLSWAASHQSMHFAFPLAIARRTAGVLAALPPSAVEVHGMGIFEKIFEIATWCINVVGAAAESSSSSVPPSPSGGGGGGSTGGVWGGAGPVVGMDLADGGELGLLDGRSGRRVGATLDPLEFFVRALSASPNSRAHFADRLLLFAAERPGGLRLALSPALSTPPTAFSAPGSPSVGPRSGWDWGGAAAAAASGRGSGFVGGSVLADALDDSDAEGSAALIPAEGPMRMSGPSRSLFGDSDIDLDLGVDLSLKGVDDRDLNIIDGNMAGTGNALATSSIVPDIVFNDQSFVSDWAGADDAEPARIFDIGSIGVSGPGIGGIMAQAGLLSSSSSPLEYSTAVFEDGSNSNGTLYQGLGDTTDLGSGSDGMHQGKGQAEKGKEHHDTNVGQYGNYRPTEFTDLGVW